MGAHDAARVYDAAPATKNKVLVRRVAITDYLIERLWFFTIKDSNNNMLVLYHSRQFPMAHGSYDLNLGLEILIFSFEILSQEFGPIFNPF